MFKNIELFSHNFVKAVGCSRCNFTGYIGRTVISEVLLFNDELSSAIINKASKSELFDIASKNGFKTMFEDGIKKASLGITTIEEIFNNSPYAKTIVQTKKGTKFV